MANRLEKGPSGRGLQWAKGASRASTAFYLLVAFEFFYMVSPFAAYLYAVYGPGLDWLSDVPGASRAVSFFLPHVVAHTTSPLVNAAEIIGGVFFAAGVGAFAIGAVQVYVSKLRRKGSVQRGAYRWIRHPQYLALMVASFGMVLVWPRFLVLFGFVTVAFVYVALARAEERVCLRQFPEYAAYRARTGMFLPRPLEAPFRLLPRPRRRALRVGLWALCYLAAMGAATFAARAVQSHAVGSLYAYYTEAAAYVSVGAMPEAQIAELAEVAMRDARVAAALRDAGEAERFINYVLPTEMYVSEIPMHLPEGVTTGHTFPRDHDPDRYKIVFTKADFGPGPAPASTTILEEALNKSPVVEAWIDRATEQVVRVFPPPADPLYDGMPVPLF